MRNIWSNGRFKIRSKNYNYKALKPFTHTTHINSIQDVTLLLNKITFSKKWLPLLTYSSVCSILVIHNILLTYSYVHFVLNANVNIHCIQSKHSPPSHLHITTVIRSGQRNRNSFPHPRHGSTSPQRRVSTGGRDSVRLSKAFRRAKRAKLEKRRNMQWTGRDRAG